MWRIFLVALVLVLVLPAARWWVWAAAPAAMTVPVTLDRIVDGAHAVVIGPGSEEWQLPAAALPPDAAEGDRLVLSLALLEVFPDPDATAAARAAARRRLEELRAGHQP